MQKVECKAQMRDAKYEYNFVQKRMGAERKFQA
jgi:hypothetical protein